MTAATRRPDTPVILGGSRTSFGRLGGKISAHDYPALASAAMHGALDASGVEAAEVDHVVLGVGVVSDGLAAPARQAVAAAEFPFVTPSLAIDRACCSGMAAVRLASDQIQLGQLALVLAGGAEAMSKTPWLLRGQRDAGRAVVGDRVMEDPLTMRSPLTNSPIARYVGEVALTYDVDRACQDEWAAQSHDRYFSAYDAGVFYEEVTAPLLHKPGTDVDVDEQARRGTTPEKLGRLSPVYGSPTVTAGNAPGLNDGAAALLVAASGKAEELGVTPIARVLATVALSGDPTSSAYLPAHAILRLLEKSFIRLADIKVIEINEAFAATAVVSLKVLAQESNESFDALAARTNVNGGAVAIGHPVGASGARIILAATLEARRRGGGLAAAAICGGFGEAEAMLLEVD